MSRKKPKVTRQPRPYVELTDFVNSQWKRRWIFYTVGAASILIGLGSLFTIATPTGWPMAIIAGVNVAWITLLFLLTGYLFFELSRHSARTEQVIDVVLPWLHLQEYDEPDLSAIEQRAAIASTNVTPRTVFPAIMIGLLLPAVSQIPVNFRLLGVAFIVCLSCSLALELHQSSIASLVNEALIEFRCKKQKAGGDSQPVLTTAAAAPADRLAEAQVVPILTDT
ncbi:hypothetical protein K2Z83_08680 [Oscillochloris sp. ZM17-4]|uniref:hypothetical protein n=1 Tax=Oscillochloris sp. ZM17-4 TaxID=2866714 RepID=UPI001C734F3B|nr:hypothetical protein [Oscillochloris sp. ZM17-4]MBX0327750.1 hypothetical protein [Oscillochloris sp. ZM17-4]